LTLALPRAQALREESLGPILGPLSMNWIAASDAGKLAVAAVLHPERFGDKSAVYPSGSEKFTHAEVAQIIGNFVGRDVKHETISAEAWQQRLADLSQCDDRINAAMARHISAVGASMREARPLNNLFETVTRERPMTLSEALSSGYLSFDRSTLTAHRL
jgi:hypothetical protein